MPAGLIDFIASPVSQMIDQRAKALGRLLGQSEEYKALKRANDELGADREAVKNLQRMEELRRRMASALAGAAARRRRS